MCPVKHRYERFEGSSANNLATWDRLMIITRPVPGADPAPTCEACGEPVLGHGRLHGAGTELACGHTLHVACMASSFAAQCPACTLSEHSEDPVKAPTTPIAADAAAPPVDTQKAGQGIDGLESLIPLLDAGIVSLRAQACAVLPVVHQPGHNS